MCSTRSLSHKSWLLISSWDNAKNALQRERGNFPFADWNGICWRLPLQHEQLIKIHFLPHLESFMWNPKFERNFSIKVLYNPPMEYFPFANYHFQMGYTVMGFAEHFGQCRGLPIFAIFLKVWEDIEFKEVS